MILDDTTMTGIAKGTDKTLKEYRQDVTQQFFLRRVISSEEEKLLKTSVKNLARSPKMANKADNLYKEILELKKLCKSYKINVKFQPNLARGLSYYNGSVFEIKAKGINESICSGGSYMINGIQSTGISFGLDRVSLVANVDTTRNTTLIVSLKKDKESIVLANKLRDKGISCSLFYGKPGKALDYANSQEIKYSVFVGDKEVKSKKFTLKNLDSGKEKKLSVDGLIKALRT